MVPRHSLDRLNASNDFQKEREKRGLFESAPGVLGERRRVVRMEQRGKQRFRDTDPKVCVSTWNELSVTRGRGKGTALWPGWPRRGNSRGRSTHVVCVGYRYS